MKFTAALVAGFVAATSAFLVVPDIPETFKDLRFKGGPPEHVKDFIHALLEGRTTSIDLDCPGCPFAKGQNEDSILWEEDGSENAIVSSQYHPGCSCLTDSCSNLSLPPTVTSSH